MRPSFSSVVRLVLGKPPLIFCRKSTEPQIACHALLLLPDVILRYVDVASVGVSGVDLRTKGNANKMVKLGCLFTG